ALRTYDSEACQIIVTIAAEGLLPEFVSVGIHPDDPVIIAAKIGAGLVSSAARGRIASEQITAVGGLLKALQRVFPGAAESALPLNIGRGKQGENRDYEGASAEGSSGITGRASDGRSAN